MKLKLIFADQGWEDVCHWMSTDRKILKRLVRLIDECRVSPFEGIGKPEPLRENLSGYWSRRITDEHRLVYKVMEGELWIAQARYHYTK
ncbi:MAG: Txe/YoeB family addiction module toxin [Akkermansiaceae bacterium]|nr:Txe/YoeB family addiction module toxin [Akkermansiaceae bacterium]MCP5543420.1 Txe/YoeB family addiction module toxin [Akkermansiaceae bacterium]